MKLQSQAFLISALDGVNGQRYTSAAVNLKNEVLVLIGQDSTGFRAGSEAVDKRKVSRGLDGIKPRSFERTVHILDTTLTELANLTNKYDDEV